MTKLFKVAAKKMLKADKKAAKIMKEPYSKPGRPKKIAVADRKLRGEEEKRKAGIEIGKFKKKRKANVVLGKTIPKEDSVKYYKQMKRFGKELDKMPPRPTGNDFIKKQAILRKYKANTVKEFKTKLKNAEAASKGQIKKAMMDFEERGGRSFPIVGKGKNPFMTRLTKRGERKLTEKELAESSKRDRFKPSPGSLSDQERRAEKARLKKIADNPLVSKSRRKEALEQSRALQYKKGGLIKRKNGGPTKPRGVGAALRGFKMKGRK
jgi:hypothetical protein